LLKRVTSAASDTVTSSYLEDDKCGSDKSSETLQRPAKFIVARAKCLCIWRHIQLKYSLEVLYVCCPSQRCENLFTIKNQYIIQIFSLEPAYLNQRQMLSSGEDFSFNHPLRFEF